MGVFPLTLSAAQELLTELRCHACPRLLQHPLALASCEHLLCGRCAQSLVSACPVCAVPCRPNDLRPQQNLHDLTFASLTLIRLLSGESSSSSANSSLISSATTPRPGKRKSSSANSSLVSATTPRPCKRNARGETPLHVASARGALDRVEVLLSDGSVDVNAADNAGWTALHEAVNRGHVEVAGALLRAGALVNAVGGDLDTPLHDAVENKRVACVELLVRQGANCDAVNAAGLTPRLLAEGCPPLLAALSTTPEVATAPLVSPVAFKSPVFLVTGLNRAERTMVSKSRK